MPDLPWRRTDHVELKYFQCALTPFGIINGLLRRDDMICQIEPPAQVRHHSEKLAHQNHLIRPRCEHVTKIDRSWGTTCNRNQAESLEWSSVFWSSHGLGTFCSSNAHHSRLLLEREFSPDALRGGRDPWPGVIGFGDTVLSQRERALLAGPDVVLLGERSRATTTGTYPTRSRLVVPAKRVVGAVGVVALQCQSSATVSHVGIGGSRRLVARLVVPIALGLPLVMFVSGCGHGDLSSTAVRVAPGSVPMTVAATGSLRVIAEPNLRNLSFPASGRLTELDVSVGDRVTVGQILAKTDNTQQQVALRKDKDDVAIQQAILSELEAGNQVSGAVDEVRRYQELLSAAQRTFDETNRLRVSGG